MLNKGTHSFQLTDSCCQSRSWRVANLLLVGIGGGGGAGKLHTCGQDVSSQQGLLICDAITDWNQG